MATKKRIQPAQHQSRQPGKQSSMRPQPVYDNPNYRGSAKLQGRVALITGGDSGIGRAVAIAFAKEGCRGCHRLSQREAGCAIDGTVGDVVRLTVRDYRGRHE